MRRKSLRVDIHCHYLNPDAAARVAPLNPSQHEAQIQFANALTREVNAKQMKDRGPKLSDIELRLKVMDRMTGFTHGQRLLDHYFSNVIGNPLETTVAASHLIFDGVLQRHPRLKIVLAHGGGYLAHYWARMDHAWRARPDCRTVIDKKPSRYLEKFYFDTIVFDRGMLAHLVERFDADHVLLGTDYPYDMGVERPVAFIGGTPGLSAADKDRIMGGNAARLLKINYNSRTRRRS